MTSTVKRRGARSVREVYTGAAHVGRNVRVLIAEARDTQPALAAFLGIGERTLRARLASPWEFRLSELEDIAKRYDVTMEWLLTGGRQSE